MKITLHFKRHFSGKFGGEEIQIHGLVARHLHDDNETDRLANTMIHILREGARENGMRYGVRSSTALLSAITTTATALIYCGITAISAIKRN